MWLCMGAVGGRKGAVNESCVGRSCMGPMHVGCRGCMEAVYRDCDGAMYGDLSWASVYAIAYRGCVCGLYVKDAWRSCMGLSWGSVWRLCMWAMEDVWRPCMVC